MFVLQAHLHDDLASLRLPCAGLPADHDGLRPLAVLRRRRSHVAVGLVRDGVHVGGLCLHEGGVVRTALPIHLVLFVESILR